MILLQFLTPRSELAASVSTASIFRFIEAEHPTFLIDEGDSFLFGNDEMRGILNSGHTRAGASVIRVEEVNGERVTKRFSTWAAKAIALIKLPPDTLVDRSIVVRLMRKPKGLRVERLRKRDSDEFKRLRNRAARWAADNDIKLIDDPPVPDTLHDRAADNWRPLLAIADLAGGNWPALARQAACDVTGVEGDGSLNVVLLTDVRTAFDANAVMKSVDLVTALVADPEKPWAEYSRGKALTQRQLARMLGEFGVISVEVHPPGLSHGKGYKRVDLEPAWEAYCPPIPGQDDPAEHFPTSQARERASADETGATRDFSSAGGGAARGAKTADLAYSHAGLRVRADENPAKADEGSTDQELGGNGGRDARDARDAELRTEGGARRRRSTVSCEAVISEEEFRREIEAEIADDEPASAVCLRCGVGANAGGPLVPCGANGSAGLYHLRCWTEQRTKGGRRKPALGPEGDSLDDLK
jgi:hypothetical protein